MATIQDIRQKFPQYNDLSDDALADRVYKKFYSDMPRAEFDRKVGAKKSAAVTEPAEKPTLASETSRILSYINEKGIADAVGAPIDLASAGLGALGLPTSKEPIGGSESIKRLMRALGASKQGDEPQTTVGKAVADVGGGAVSALLSGGAIGGTVRKAGELLAKPALEEVGRVLASPAGNIAAGAGGGAGGAIGREAAKGTTLEKPAEIGGELLGGALAGFAPSTALRAAKAVDPVLAAYERLKLAPSAAEAGVGGRAAQWLEGNILPQTLGGGGVMEKFKQRRLRQLTDLQQSIAAEYGATRPRAEMGRSVQDSVMDSWLRAKDREGSIIGALKKKYDSDVVYVGNLVNAVANPVGAATSRSVRDATLDPLVADAAKMIRASGGHLTFADLAALKGKFGQALEPGFQKNVNDAQVSQLYDAVRDDMEEHIKTKSPRDYAALQVANKSYAQAQRDFKRYFKKLVGTKEIPVSSERAYEIVTGAASENGRGDLAEFKHVWDALPAQEQGNLSATILARLGATDRGDPAAMETWSLGKFLSGYRDLSPEARNILFKNKPKVAQALDDLVAVTQNVERKVQRLASTSRSGTGAVMLGQFGVGGILAHLTDGDLTRGLLYGMGGPWLAAQTLTNPTAVRTLAATMRRVDAALDASARAVVDLNAIPKPLDRAQREPPPSAPASAP